MTDNSARAGQPGVLGFLSRGISLRSKESSMARKVTYWVSTGLLAALSVFAAFTYLSGGPQPFKDSRTWDIRSNYASFWG